MFYISNLNYDHIFIINQCNLTIGYTCAVYRICVVLQIFYELITLQRFHCQNTVIVYVFT